MTNSPLATTSPSNLVRHARRELELIETDPWFIDGIVRVVQAFADMGHSGGSAAIAIHHVHELLQFHNLSDLTDDPDEWVEVGQSIWQSSRRSEAFSNNGGTTYYLLSEGFHPDGTPNITYTSKKHQDGEQQTPVSG